MYLWGCDVQDISSREKVAEGRTNCVRIIPCVPRKDSKSTKGVSDENNVILAFESEEMKMAVKKFVALLALPPMPQRVADYMRSIGELQ